ncbi:MAG: tRNA guanosine(34) transglycosylase Tgt [Patescibacteria group bacterium]
MFEIVNSNGKKRIGKLLTNHGELETPFFMPDATRGFVRSLDNEDLIKASVSPIVVNTYHLYLKPGMELIKKAGGIHNFMNWQKPLLSDSGGYQVFSLIHKNPKMGKITKNEVIFKSPYDGSIHKLTPEKSIQIQFDLGVDMMVCLDDPPPNNYSKEKIEKAVERTIIWAERCKKEYNKQVKSRKLKVKSQPLIFGVIQGGKYLDLRKHCAEELVKIGFDGYGFGARHIDEEGNIMDKVLEEVASYIPENSLRFALGVGTPEDIVKCVNYGWDMFDCVIPTREGRHGRIFVRKSEVKSQKSKVKSDFYETININNEKYANDFSKVDENCGCEMCQNYSKSYMRYLFSQKEPMAMRLASLHNLKFYMDLMENLRNK